MSQKSPKLTLDAISTTIKSEGHFWHLWDELLSNICQLSVEGIRTLSTHICTLITQCKVAHPKTVETLKIMVLQHTVQYHEAQDWIQLQNQSHLTYSSLLAQCRLLESNCKQFQKAKEKGQADLTSITAVTSTVSSVHVDALNAYPCCNKCGYSHPPTKCLTKGQTCYNCGSHNHYMALCRSK